MALIYWLSKFSQEAILLELFLIACVATAYFGYLLVQKRKYGAAKKDIPDNVVRAFLIELMSYTEGFKNQLFGEDFKIPTHQISNLINAAGPVLNATVSTGAADPAELNALKNALATAVAKQEELSKSVGGLTADKTSLEAKLAAALANAGGGAAVGDKEMADKLARLESRLAEYEVIEDDLANLKKYQQENKQLRAQLDALSKGAAPAPIAAAPTPPPEPSPIAAAEETITATKAAENFEGLVDKVEESLAAPPTDSAADPMAIAAAQTVPAVSDTPAAPPPVAAAPPPPPAPAAVAPPSAEKTDADLLNEFERMLSS